MVIVQQPTAVVRFYVYFDVLLYMIYYEVCMHSGCILYAFL